MLPPRSFESELSENLNAGDSVMSFTTQDLDLDDQFTYSFAQVMALVIMICSLLMETNF